MEMKSLCQPEKVSPSVVETFLKSLDLEDTLESQLQRLLQQTALNGWNKTTRRAIQDGLIRMYLPD